jgi:pilus assembly protein Flp/PilA
MWLSAGRLQRRIVCAVLRAETHEIGADRGAPQRLAITADGALQMSRDLQSQQRKAFQSLSSLRLLRRKTKLRIGRFVRSEDGPTAVEYAVMLSLIVVVCLSTIKTLGSNAKASFSSVSASLGTSGS